MRKPRIYVAGPLFGSGSIGDNIRIALREAELIRAAGGLPFVPHLYFFWDLIVAHGRNFWLELDRDWVLSCDAVLRIGGISPGSDMETNLAESEDIPVFTNSHHICNAIRNGKIKKR